MKQMAVYSSLDFLNIPSQCRAILVFNVKCTAPTMCALCNHSYDFINITSYRAIIFYAFFKRKAVAFHGKLFPDLRYLEII